MSNVRIPRPMLPLIMLLSGCLLTGCAVTTKIQSPLPIKDFPLHVDEGVGLFIADYSRAYVWHGSINVVDYQVEFGNGLEPNAIYALSKVFRDVRLLDCFPVPATSSDGITQALSLGIEGADVTPGAATWSSTSSVLRLRGVLAKGMEQDRKAINVEGRGEASPGFLGFIPLFAVNQVAYNKALQRASEQAMTDALNRLVDAIVQDEQRTAP